MSVAEHDEAIVLRDTTPEELVAICQIEQSHGHGFVVPYSIERHRQEFARADVRYKSIYSGASLVGFVILVLDPDGISVELRRIVVATSGQGIGRQALQMVGHQSRAECRRTRIWLDVFMDNDRARRIYEAAGYRRCGTSDYGGRVLHIYELTANGGR